VVSHCSVIVTLQFGDTLQSYVTLQSGVPLQSGITPQCCRTGVRAVEWSDAGAVNLRIGAPRLS